MRKHKFVNKTPYPDYVVERFTRCIFEDVLAYFATEEGQREYALWEAEQKAEKSGPSRPPTVPRAPSGEERSTGQTEGRSGHGTKKERP